ncbi:interleukin-13 receptor subunit alpha-1-like [Sinocyclocheilus grahami]|uniref:Interleukin-13 receptor subunit alpha-1-like n=1 Tax=Sinocyclocheilus grahami TaxID=75366 RepID=A0A672QQJ0_SINGR|nr:PREDICTED: interleukin-13 receptor subunit alpha-1-like [Sinocyclocheilus grahami]
MFRVWDISLVICFSLSLMFVGVEGASELPPPRNLTFKWETPFTLNLTWEKPKDLEPDCKVNYTVNAHHSQDCSERAKQDMSGAKNTETRRVQNMTCKLNISNENGLCISVTVNPENCGNKYQSPPLDISIPPPPVRLVKNRSCEYSHNRLKCTWHSDVDVKDLGFYYWSPQNETVIKCNEMKIGECVIHDTFLKHMTNMLYLFNGTYKGKPVNNTFMDERPVDLVKLNKPQLTIQRFGQSLHFQTTVSDLDEFAPQCYRYNYIYSMCDKSVQEKDMANSKHVMDYDSNCKYRARVQINFSYKCGAGKSDLSDEVEYGENRDPNLPALLAVIIIPLIVSCCLIVSLVLLRRHKDIIFPKIPEPTLIFKDMLINNIRTAEDLRSTADGRLYIPIEEIVESKISLEPETPLIPTTTNTTHKQV